MCIAYRISDSRVGLKLSCYLNYLLFEVLRNFVHVLGAVIEVCIAFGVTSNSNGYIFYK